MVDIENFKHIISELDSLLERVSYKHANDVYPHVKFGHIEYGTPNDLDSGFDADGVRFYLMYSPCGCCPPECVESFNLSWDYILAEMA